MIQIHTAKRQLLKAYAKMVEDIERRIVLVANAKKDFGEQEARREQEERDEDLDLRRYMNFEISTAPFDDGELYGSDYKENVGSEEHAASNKVVFVDAQVGFAPISMMLPFSKI
jgi:hypothetical protein